jgi:glycosyltransferase involved in cell wall biosynthesis
LVVRDAVDPGLFRPLSRTAARQRLGVPPDDVLVIFPHDVRQATKRLSLAEAAVKRLQAKVRSARLWVVNGAQADEMPWYYAAADVLIVTSLLEAGPSSAKEALACGLPVVSVPVGDTRLASEAPAGFLLADANPDDLARALASVLLREGAERVSLLPPELTLARAAQTLHEIYEDALRS